MALAATEPALVTAPAAPAAAQGVVTLGIPGRDWRLVADLPGYRLAPVRVAGDGALLVALGENPGTGIVVSVLIEQQPDLVTTRDCLEHYGRLTRRRSPVSRAGVEGVPHPAASVVAYTLEGAQDGGFHQRHVNAYLRHDGFCVDIHVSKDACLQREEGMLVEAVRSFRIAGVEETTDASEAAALPDPAPVDGERGTALRAFPIHDRPLALVLDARGVVMEVSRPRYAFDIQRRKYKGQKVTGWAWGGQRIPDRVVLQVIARLEEEERNARAWRDRLWPEIDLGLLSRPEGVTRGEREGVAWVDYTRPWRQRARIDARSRHLFLAKGDVVASAHLEIVDPRPEDEAALAAFLAAARFEARDAPPGARPAAPTGPGPPTRR